MPAHTAPHKSRGEASRRDPGPQHRLAMCRLAVARADRVGVCAAEIQRRGVSYTVDTLTALHAAHPHAQLTLIVGADVASTLGSWREPARLLELARLAIAARPRAPRQSVLNALAALAPPERVSFLQMDPIEVSSSLVRERVARGEPIEALVGAPVAAYIAQHRLYRVPAPVAD